MSSLLAVAKSKKICKQQHGTVGEASNLMTPDPDFDLTRGVGATIRESSRSRRFDRNQFLFHAGEPSGGMYLIVAGFVAVRLGTPSGEMATVAVLGTGHCLGEQSLLAELGHRSTSAVALGTVDTLNPGSESQTASGLAQDHIDAPGRARPGEECHGPAGTGASPLGHSGCRS